MNDDDTIARIGLSHAAEPGDAALGAWVADVGAVSAWADLRRGRCPARRASAYVARVDAMETEPVALLDQARSAGIGVVVPGGPEWPTQLDDLAERRPLLLWTRGPAPLRTSAVCSVAVVGARAATGYGASVAADLAAGLGGERWTVVSGGAYGIDAAAHQGALAVDATTIAVLANGVDRVYPSGNDALLARVLDTGLVVSELPPGAHPTRPRFLERNRVVAALTRGTVVVEAAARSGALATAHRAADLGRVVMAVPGPVTSAASVGTHRLVRDHEAVLVTGTRDVLDLVGPLAPDAAAGAPPEEVGRSPLDGLPPELVLVHEALGARSPRDVTALAIRAGLSEGVVLGLLGDLRARGLAERVEGGWRVPRPRAAGPNG